MSPKRYSNQAFGKTIKSISMDAEIADWIEKKAKDSNLPVSTFINNFLRQQIEKAAGAKPITEFGLDGPTRHKGATTDMGEIPLHYAAAGEPVDSHIDSYVPPRLIGPGRIACKVRGNSMLPKIKSGEILILREKSTLKKPVLKKGYIYLFLVGGEKTIKEWQSRFATPEEIERGITYKSPKDGKDKVPVLRSLSPDYPDIAVGEDVEWIGWLDPDDNRDLNLKR